MKVYLDSTDIDGTIVEGVEYDPLGWKFNSLIEEVKDFVSAVVDKRPPKVDPLDAVFCVQCVEVTEKSIKSQQRVFL